MISKVRNQLLDHLWCKNKNKMKKPLVAGTVRRLGRPLDTAKKDLTWNIVLSERLEKHSILIGLKIIFLSLPDFLLLSLQKFFFSSPGKCTPVVCTPLGRSSIAAQAPARKVLFSFDTVSPFLWPLGELRRARWEAGSSHSPAARSLSSGARPCPLPPLPPEWSLILVILAAHNSSIHITRVGEYPKLKQIILKSMSGTKSLKN